MAKLSDIFISVFNISTGLWFLYHGPQLAVIGIINLLMQMDKQGICTNYLQ